MRKPKGFAFFLTHFEEGVNIVFEIAWVYIN